MSILSLLNLLFNLIFSGILIYLIIRNNQLANQCSQSTKGNKGLQSSQSSSKIKSLKDSNIVKTKKTDSKNKNNEHKTFYFNKELCLKCIKENEGKKSNEIRNCPHCGSENYDTGCIPAILQKGLPKNCIPKKNFTKEQAFRACVGVSSLNQQCNLVDIDNADSEVLSYMKEECGEDSYYCAYDESDSCSYNLCKLDDYYSYGDESSYCNCEPSKSATDIMGSGWGRECKRGNKCLEYYPLRKSPELWTNNQLNKFYKASNGPPTYMDVPNLDSPMAAMLYNSKII